MTSTSELVSETGYFFLETKLPETATKLSETEAKSPVSETNRRFCQQSRPFRKQNIACHGNKCGQAFT